jgi:hypothetical protein
VAKSSHPQLRRLLDALAAQETSFVEAQQQAYDAVEAYALARQYFADATENFFNALMKTRGGSREILETLETEGANLSPLRVQVPGGSYFFANLLGRPLQHTPVAGSVHLAVSLDLLIAGTRAITVEKCG